MKRDTRPILDDLRAHSRGTALWWLGNAGWAIKIDDVTLLVDPVIETQPDDPTISEIRLALVHELPLRASELGDGDVDMVLVTHGHGDHLAPRTIPTLAERTRCLFVTPLSCTARMRELGVPRERIVDARHGEMITHRGVSIEPMKALHGHELGSVYRRANFQDCGYLIRGGGRTIYHPGDTVLLHEHLEMAPPDVFLCSISEHNLWVRNSALLAERWRPEIIAPMHYDTYEKEIYWTVGDPEAVRRALPAELRERLVVVRQGEKLALPAK